MEKGGAKALSAEGEQKPSLLRGSKSPLSTVWLRGLGGVQFLIKKIYPNSQWGWGATFGKGVILIPSIASQTWQGWFHDDDKKIIQK